MENEGGGPITAFELNEEILGRMERNDPSVANIWISEKNWIEGAGLAIAKSTCLKKLSLWAEGEFDDWIPRFCKKWLQRNRSIETFSLIEDRSFYFCDSAISCLAPFFNHNHNLRSVSFSCLGEYKYWDIEYIMKVLSACKNDQLERIELYHVKGSGAEVVGFLNMLCTKQQNLLQLDLSDLFEHQDDAWTTAPYAALANLLESPATKIQELRIQLGGLDTLADVLMSNETLTSLDLSYSSLCEEGLLEFVDVLPTCSLEKLSMNSTYIGDNELNLIGTALAENETLKHLDLSDSYEITAAGWQEFSKCLKNPHSALEELDLRGCQIDDEKAAAIFSILSENSCLEILHMKTHNRTAVTTHQVWKVLFRALCDTSSIDSIAFSSNHALHTLDICSEENGAPEDVISLLEMNKHDSKAETARRKILKHHLPEGKSKLQVFARMPETVMPCALGWIGRDHHGFSVMYNVLQSLPSFVGNSITGHNAAGMKKRKLLCTATTHV
jgi:hypothetical protein